MESQRSCDGLSASLRTRRIRSSVPSWRDQRSKELSALECQKRMKNLERAKGIEPRTQLGSQPLCKVFQACFRQVAAKPTIDFKQQFCAVGTPLRLLLRGLLGPEPTSRGTRATTLRVFGATVIREVCEAAGLRLRRPSGLPVLLPRSAPTAPSTATRSRSCWFRRRLRSL
jgi:hypothetical protein